MTHACNAVVTTLTVFFFFFFFMNGNTERAQCALSLVCIPQEMGKKGSKKNKKKKKFIKYSKRVIKKSCHLVPMVAIDLPFEGRKVEGSQKYRGRERVQKGGGSRREETITEPINSRIGEFHTIIVRFPFS